MSSDVYTTPYFTLQHLLREIAKCLGTKKLAGKKIDDACKKVEINPHQLASLKKELIHAPLSKYVNVYFADHMLREYERVESMYMDLIKGMPLDGVQASKAREVIGKYFMTFAIAELCRDMLEGMSLTPNCVAEKRQPLMPLAIASICDGAEWQKFYKGATPVQKERIRVWSLGLDIPELDSIASMGEPWRKGNSWGIYKARLITARIWDYYFSQNDGVHINLLSKLSAEGCWKEMVRSLGTLLTEGTERYCSTTNFALGLFDLLRLRKPKQTDDKEHCLELLTQLDAEQKRLDKDNETTYYYHWMKARYHLHAGELPLAISCYKLAFELVLYRQGENTSHIIVEAITASCRCAKPDKKFINRLRRMAVLFKLDLLPPKHSNDVFKAKVQEIEHWEIAAFSQYFNAMFPKESFFPGSNYPADPHENNGIWMVDESAHVLDLVKPNKPFSVGMEGGLVKKMPQLVYFSMLDEFDAVARLLGAGADVNKLSSSNESAILLAIQAMQINLTQLNSMDDGLFKLISEKTHRKSILDSLSSKRKLSPLGCAVQTGRVDIVKKVLEMGATIDRRHDTIGETPLFTAIGMIAHHTRPKLHEMHWDILKFSDMNLQSVRAYSAGLMPFELEHLKKAMMEQQNDPVFRLGFNATKGYVRENIVRHSTADCFRAIAKLLIEYGADVNAKHDTAMLGYTPFMLAVELDEAELVEAMLKSQHHKPNLSDTCVETQRGRRINISQLIINWGSYKVHTFLTENE
ncbi:ankyrin repeat domain-containing protein [Photobacterium sp. CAU 1568]|uniref:Ankyrin repeat domain-containing protein n=1 Tax=Photobacterium arenosum TaxID=2774143 RepID=A0ABR9BK11_9GAMM|nr:ankyrin repeat domain-containing protein [Photobacterium arenosum]MBD8512913.1 ankyrin repeat domain-containing protein [Photobacterium arenosum]